MNPLQRTSEWHEARAGKLTASNFAAAIGISPYQSRAKLWRELKGLEPGFEGNAATDWGTEHEPFAISDYEIRSGNLVIPSPFVAHPEFPWLGASPDGLVGDGGCIEAKCPYGQQLYGTVPEHYRPQVAGVLEVTNRSWCDFICWTPDIAEITRVNRDPDYWNWMFPLLQEFWFFVTTDREPPRLKAKPVYQLRKA